MPPWRSAGISPPTAVTRPQRVNVVPHTHWDREWYRTVPGPPAGARRGARRPARRPRRPTPRSPTSCSTARWPRWTTTSRCGPRREAELRAHLRSGRVADGTLVHAARRVPRLGRDPRARPRARDGPGRRAGRPGGCRDGRRLPARHVRPHRPDAAAARPGRPRPRGGVARRAGRGRPDRVLVGGAGRHRGAGRVPADGLRQRRPHAGGPRRFLARLDALGRARRGPRARRPDPADERHRPPPPPARAGAAARRRDHGERGALRRAPHAPCTSTSPARPTDGLPRWRGELRSSARANLLMASPPTGSTSARPRREPSARSSRMAEPLCAAVRAGRALARAAAGPGLEGHRAQRRARLGVRLLARRGGRRGAPPLRRGPADRRWPASPGPAPRRRRAGGRRAGRGQPARPAPAAGWSRSTGPATDPSPASSCSPRPRR